MRSPYLLILLFYIYIYIYIVCTSLPSICIYSVCQEVVEREKHGETTVK